MEALFKTNATMTTFHILSVGELIRVSISLSIAHLLLHTPIPIPTHHPHLLLLQAGGCFKLSGKLAIKQRRTELGGHCWY